MALHDIQVPEVVRPVVTRRICDGETCSDYLYARWYRIVQCSDCGLRFVNPQGFDRAIRDTWENIAKAALMHSRNWPTIFRHAVSS
jgi:hypothetical protein